MGRHQNSVGKEENPGYWAKLKVFANVAKVMIFVFDRVENINPLPDMPILGSSNSAANKDMM